MDRQLIDALPLRQSLRTKRLALVVFAGVIGPTLAHALPPTPPPNIILLNNLETQANPMDRTRSTEIFELEYYEIPSNRPIALTEGMDPRIRKALTVKNSAGKYVFRWIINPEDATFHKKVAEWLVMSGYDSKPHRGGLYAMRTASASYLVCGEDGYWFSAKVSTDHTGGKWQDKGLNSKQMRIARANSTIAKLISESETRPSTFVFQLDAGGLSIPDENCDQSMILRDLGEPANNPALELVPLFAFADATAGPEYAKRAGAKNIFEYYKHYLAPLVGTSTAELLARYNFILHAPHGQNMLVEFHKGGGPTGRLYFRDVQDMHYWGAYVTKLLGGKSVVAEVNPKRVDARALIASGFFHGLDTIPEFLRAIPGFSRKAIDDAFFSTFSTTLAREFSLPSTASVQLENVSYSTDSSYSTAYVSESVLKKVPETCGTISRRSVLRGAGYGGSLD